MTTIRHPERLHRLTAVVRLDKALNCAFEPKKLLILITNHHSKQPKKPQKTIETNLKIPTKTQKKAPNPRKTGTRGFVRPPN
jgi:hypothetical protein